MGRSGLSSLIRPRAVKPSPSGMRTSKSTTSTSCSNACFTTAAPVVASATTLISVPASMALTPLRSTSWSSAINSRILSFGFMRNSSRQRLWAAATEAGHFRETARRLHLDAGARAIAHGEAAKRCTSEVGR